MIRYDDYDYIEPTFYQDYTNILVDPTLFEVLAEVGRVYVEDCADTTPSTPSSSLPSAARRSPRGHQGSR